MSTLRVADRALVQRLDAEGAQVVKVLPVEEHEEEHLPGAVHLPLKTMSPETLRVLDVRRPVIGYCGPSM